MNIKGKGEIVFNEIMYDPLPEIGLPAYEYIELYNRSTDTVWIEGWTLHAGSRILDLPDYKILPGTFLLLCYRDKEDLYGGEEHILDILSSRTMLLNNGSVLLLYNPDYVLIDWMEYSPIMHSSEYYAEGGWSLERIDPDRTCHSPDNWTSSSSRMGGTPGMINSVLGTNPDRNPPVPVSVYFQEPSLEDMGSFQQLVIEFNESLDRNSALNKYAWHVDGGMDEPDSILLPQPYNSELSLFYRKEFKPGMEYTLEIRAGIKDCSGNLIRPGLRIPFAQPVEPGRSEILISEILFNPLPYCPDFIEVFNPTSKTFDLADLCLANRDAYTGEMVSVNRLISGHRLFFPEEFLVFTKDPESLSGFFLIQDPNSLVRIADMPVMEDIEGSVILLDKYLGLIDEIYYNRDMHHQLLASPEGVSLERISYETGSEYLSNWQSAASNEGYATPGRKNSQSLPPDAGEEGIEVEPEIFSPDMDGIDDVLWIKYRFQSPGLLACIRIFDPRGRLLREIAVGALLGTEGFYTWDGCDRQGRRARTGAYLVLAEVSGLDRHVVRYRKICVLSVGR